MREIDIEGQEADIEDDEGLNPDLRPGPPALI